MPVADSQNPSPEAPASEAHLQVKACGLTLSDFDGLGLV
jgi:hypothetical protein